MPLAGMLQLALYVVMLDSPVQSIGAFLKLLEVMPCDTCMPMRDCSRKELLTLACCYHVGCSTLGAASSPTV